MAVPPLPSASPGNRQLRSPDYVRYDSLYYYRTNVLICTIHCIGQRSSEFAGMTKLILQGCGGELVLQKVDGHVSVPHPRAAGGRSGGRVSVWWVQVASANDVQRRPSCTLRPDKPRKASLLCCSTYGLSHTAATGDRRTRGRTDGWGMGRECRRAPHRTLPNLPCPCARLSCQNDAAPALSVAIPCLRAECTVLLYLIGRPSLTRAVKQVLRGHKHRGQAGQPSGRGVGEGGHLP